MKSKIRNDFRDIDEMLTLINDSHRLEVIEWLPAAFIDTSREHVKAFVLRRKERWNAIGFDRVYTCLYNELMPCDKRRTV